MIFSKEKHTKPPEKRETKMDISIIIKIFGVGMLVAIACQILNKSKNDDIAFYVSLAGIIIIGILLIGKIGELFSTLKSVFGF